MPKNKKGKPKFDNAAEAVDDLEATKKSAKIQIKRIAEGMAPRLSLSEALAVIEEAVEEMRGKEANT